MNRAEALEQARILKALIEIAEVDILLSTFISAFKTRSKQKMGIHFLFGNFNLGGTVSGRLSSSKPNLQNIPSTSKYAKVIKKCFQAPKGWVFCGADFNSLEDYISALTTKDPNKLKVYIEGFDGHCLRAANYFREDLPHIDLNDPKSVNSIKETHPNLRQDSKGPTFALTYQGTWHTLVTNLGWTEEKAKAVEAGYHEMYKVSDEWVQSKLQQASKDGYVTVAFGLRVRTPILKQTILNAAQVPYEAKAESRTAGNALGQSYGLLNNRAGIEMRKRVLASPYKYDILPISHIHDAQYFLVREDAEIMAWFNKNLVECMQWQDLPEIQHPTVKIGGEVDVFYPSWAEATTLPINATAKDIVNLFKE